jgi:hypothetical protein
VSSTAQLNCRPVLLSRSPAEPGLTTSTLQTRIALVAVLADMVLIVLPYGNGPPPIWGGIGMRTDLHRLWMQRFSDNLPRIIHTTHRTGRAITQFRTEAGPRLLSGGLEMHPTNILRHSEGDVYHHR